MAAFLAHLGNPERSFKSFHVAGTNGKGTVSTIIYRILQAHGHKVGLYTSPHLLKFNERIVVDDITISDEEIAQFVDKHKLYIDEAELTFFEITTAMAFDSFSRNSVEYAVVEVGLGGRLDATNLLIPLVSVICDISMDHEDWLGNDVKLVAAEKAGIIKSGVPVVTGITNPDANGVVSEKSEEKKACLFDLFKCATWNIIDQSQSETIFNLSILNSEAKRFVLPMPALHQVQNCSLALLAVCAASVPTTSEKEYKGILASRLKGRLEYIESKPSLIIDVAHNPKKIFGLTEYLKKFFMNRKKVAVFGVMKDKNYREMVGLLKECVDVFVFTQPSVERALPAVALLDFATGEVIPNVELAIKRAKEIAGYDGLVIVTGSFYTVGEFLEIARI
jgi:dihydrofolate synthase/folylpolyglutamate synthase